MKEILLTVYLIMPADKRDVMHNELMPADSMTECWERAKAFTDRDISEDMRKNGVIGFGAACYWREKANTPQ